MFINVQKKTEKYWELELTNNTSKFFYFIVTN